MDLEELLSEFDQQVGDFADDRLNRALDKARRDVVEGSELAALPDPTGSLRQLRAAMHELEKGAGVPASGSGFADDLASLGSLFVEVFVADVILLAAQLGVATPAMIAEATVDFESGVADRDNGEWEAAVMKFTRAIQGLDQALEIGAPCELTGGS